MNVLALTIFVTIWLAGVFLFFFLYTQRGPGAGRHEQDALRPLDGELRRGVSPGKRS